MPFDIKTARPVKSGKFDITTARPIDRLNSIPKSGTSFAMAGPISGDIKGMIDVGEEALPAITTALGIPFGPVGLATGAAIGELGKQGIRSLRGTRNSPPRRLLGIGPKAPGIVNDVTGSVGGTMAGEAAFNVGIGALNAATRKVAPYAHKAAISIIERMIKPTGEMATGEMGQKGSQIAENLLRERLAKGGLKSMVTQASLKSKSLLREVENYLKQYKNREVNPQNAIQYIDDVIAKQKSYADPDLVEKLKKVKENIIQEHGLTHPIYGDVEKGAFELHGGQITKPKKVLLETPQYGSLGESRGSLKKGRIIPETIYQGQTRGIKGPSILKKEIVGEELNPIPVGKAQALKKGQYQKIGESAYGEMASPEKELRKSYARGLRQGIEEAIPEAPIARKNERIGDLSEAIDVLAHRLGVSKRLNLANIADQVLAGMFSPASIGAVVTKKTLGLQPVQTGLARRLYAVGRKMLGKQAQPFIKRILSQETGRRIFQ